KSVYEEAEEEGISPKALKRTIRLRKLQRDIEGLSSKLDMDEAAQFSALAEAFAGTPFGEHAKLRAAMAGAEVTVHPAVETREDEEHLSRIGRGPSDADVVDELAQP